MPFTDWLIKMENEYVIGYTNVETGETILKPMTDEEISQRKAEVATWLAEKAARKEALAEKALARQALLDKLGITAEEAQLLLGGN